MEMEWDADAEKELEKVPMFFRKQARSTLIAYAKEKGVSRITMTEVQEAKEKYLGGDD